NEAYKSFGVEPLGGASPDGWSKIADYQRCPYRYYLLHELADAGMKVGASKPDALEIGSLYHAMLACHYLTSGNSGSELYPTPYALAERVLSVGGDQTIIDECKRLYAAYFNQYGNVADEGVKALGVDLPCGIEGFHF